jgi:hypothetical protein
MSVSTKQLIEQIVAKYRHKLAEGASRNVFALLNSIIDNDKLDGVVRRLCEETPPSEVDKQYNQFLCDYYTRLYNFSKAEARRRLSKLLELDKSVVLQKEEIERCRRDIYYWMETYTWMFEPRNPVTPIVPVKLFDIQRELISMLWDSALVSGKDLLIEKSRAVGATWCTLLFFTHRFLFSSVTERGGENFLCCSISSGEVDKLGDMSTLLEKIRFTLYFLPHWMVPKGIEKNLSLRKLVNPSTGSSIIGAAMTKDVGRSGRYTAIMLDEAASMLFLQDIITASSQSTNCRIFISTPKGKANHFYDLRERMTNKLRIHWSQNPFLDARWYEYQKARLKPEIVAQELDINYDVIRDDRIYTNWEEPFHVITWKQLCDKLPQIKHPAKLDKYETVFPKNWALSRGTDWAFGTGTSKNVTLWIARAPEDTITTKGFDVSGFIFVVWEYIAPPRAVPKLVHEEITAIDSMLCEPEQIVQELISHEALTECEIFNSEYGHNFRPWRLGYFDSISKILEYLEPEELEHPFKDGNVFGCPRLYVVIDDKIQPMLRFREEIRDYKYDSTTTLKGVEHWRPLKVKDDAMDCLRGLALEWPPVMELGVKEKFERSLPETVQYRTIAAELKSNNTEKAVEMYIARQLYLAEQREIKAKQKLLRRYGLHRRVVV